MRLYVCRHARTRIVPCVQQLASREEDCSSAQNIRVCPYYRFSRVLDFCRRKGIVATFGGHDVALKPCTFFNLSLRPTNRTKDFVREVMLAKGLDDDARNRSCAHLGAELTFVVVGSVTKGVAVLHLLSSFFCSKIFGSCGTRATAAVERMRR